MMHYLFDQHKCCVTVIEPAQQWVTFASSFQRPEGQQGHCHQDWQSSEGLPVLDEQLLFIRLAFWRAYATLPILTAIF
jgi:hypothetical protein